jgi:hypothetical protein
MVIVTSPNLAKQERASYAVGLLTDKLRTGYGIQRLRSS